MNHHACRIIYASQKAVLMLYFECAYNLFIVLVFRIKGDYDENNIY